MTMYTKILHIALSHKPWDCNIFQSTWDNPHCVYIKEAPKTKTTYKNLDAYMKCYSFINFCYIYLYRFHISFEETGTYVKAELKQSLHQPGQALCVPES